MCNFVYVAEVILPMIMIMADREYVYDIGHVLQLLLKDGLMGVPSLKLLHSINSYNKI